MKVYILKENTWDGTNVLGIYKDKDIPQYFVDKYDKTLDYRGLELFYWVEEQEIIERNCDQCVYFTGQYDTPDCQVCARGKEDNFKKEMAT